MLQAVAPYALTVLRILVGLLFMEHGTQKLFGFPTPSQPMPAMFTLPWIAGCLEFAGGLLVAVGFKTRAAAFVISGEMAFAYWIAHAPRNFFPVLNGGDAAVLYCFVFLYLVFAGAGPVSMDHGMGGRSRG